MFSAFDGALQHGFAFFVAQFVDGVVDAMDVVELKTFIARVVLEQGLELIKRAKFQALTDCRAWVMLEEFVQVKTVISQDGGVVAGGV